MLIKKVGAFSLAKILVIIYGFLGFLVGLIFSFVSMIGAIVGAKFADSPEPFFGMIFGVGAIILFPVVYGTLGFVGGLIISGIYNIAAKWTGGIEIEVVEKPVISAE